MGVQSGFLRLLENLDEPEHGPEQPEQRRHLRDRGKQTQLLLQPRHLDKPGLLNAPPGPAPGHGRGSGWRS